MSNFLVSRISPGGNIRLVLAHATAGEHQAWSLSERDARALRDALTLALGAGLPRTGPATGPSLGCRITGRGKPCRGCGAESGHAHAATCSAASYGGPERRASSRTPGENDEVPEEREFSGADLTQASFPPSAYLTNRFPPQG